MKTGFLKSFSKDLDSINQPNVKNDIYKAIENVENAKSPREIKNLKKLKKLKNAFRIKIGDYRIGIFIVKDTVEFARVVHRNLIYHIFP
jgi:mRNA-degrading endonuclease RelE of RelBE toxin-antitoxin system